MAPRVGDTGPVLHTVLIADDHAGFRASARRLLEAAGWTVVGEAHDGLSALALSEELAPALVLLDVQMPGLDGFAVAERITAAPDAPAVVLTSSHDVSDFGPLVATSGARGFVPKSELSGARLAALLP